MDIKLQIPNNALEIISILNTAGYEAFCVGGCVRDGLMGKAPQDWDITTNATPTQVIAAIPEAKIIETGIKHGTVTVILNHEHFEVTTFRIDGEYNDCRRPESIEFTTNLRDDLARRDFTINAMAYHAKNGLIDPFCGMEDLEKGVLRAVGDGEIRFREDALRIMRGMRFASVLGFEIEEKTALAMENNRELLLNISAERIFSELLLLLCGKNAEKVLNEYYGIIGVIMPEILPSVGFDQRNRHHIFEVWEHTVCSVASIKPDPILRLTMLLHDLGKPESFSLDINGEGHFYGHGAISTELAGNILKRLKVDSDKMKRTLLLVKYHDSAISAEHSSVKHWMAKIGKDALQDLIHVKRADNLAQNPEYSWRQSELDTIQRILDEVIKEDECFSLRQLAVKGTDIIDKTGLHGAMVGKILSGLLEMVLNGECENEKFLLLSKINSIIMQIENEK